MLLDLDPFVSGGPQAQLPADRFALQEIWEYGFGTIIPKSVSMTRDTKTTVTEKSYTTTTDEWDPGPIFQLLGFGGKDQTTTTVSNATGSDVSLTIAMSATLVSDPTDHFIVNIWYDNLFGTFAFQEVAPPASPMFQGSGAATGQIVTLTAGGKIFGTVADKNGHFSFHAPSIPAGSAMLSIGTKSAKPVMIAHR